MTSSPNLGRRAFVLSQAALLTMAGLPPLFAASLTSTASFRKQNYADLRWETVTARGLAQFLGQRFEVRTECYGDIVVCLSSVDEVASGPHRPRSLARQEGLIASFESPDLAPLVRAGHQTYRVRHFWLGEADLFMGPVPRRTGGHVLELILN